MGETKEFSFENTGLELDVLLMRIQSREGVEFSNEKRRGPKRMGRRGDKEEKQVTASYCSQSRTMSEQLQRSQLEGREQQPEKDSRKVSEGCQEVRKGLEDMYQLAGHWGS